jgi:NADH dehydrogenase
MALAEKPTDRKRVLIVGAGFGGLSCAHKLAGSGLEVVLIDKNDYAVFQPMLYQVAAAGLDAEAIAEPIQKLVGGWAGVTFAVATAQGLDPDKKVLQTSIGPIPYHYLVLAAGNVPTFFGNESIHKAAFTLTTLPMAEALRNHVLTMFEQAQREPDPAKRRELLTFVAVGGGPIGVEFSGALGTMVTHFLGKVMPGVKRDEVTLRLLEAGPTLLPPFPSHAREYAHKAIAELGVDVQLNAMVQAAESDTIILKDGTRMPAKTLLWATGVMAPAFTSALNLPLAHGGRLEVGEDFSVKGHPEVFAIGDVASYLFDGVPLPGMAQPAVQGGEYVAEVITKVREKGETIKPFSYHDKGIMAVIGRRAAVAGIPKHGHDHEMKTPAEQKYNSLTGFPAWTAWLGLHMVYLRGFHNKWTAVANWSHDRFEGPKDLHEITSLTKEEAQAAVDA